MAPISLDSMEFYAPPARARRPSPSAQAIPPTSSTTAATATVEASARGQRAQLAEAQHCAELLHAEAEAADAGTFDKPMPNVEGVKVVQDNKGSSGKF